MDKNILIKEIINFIKEKLTEQNIGDEIDRSSKLFGSDSLLDSMNLVELCLVLEDISNEKDFMFDWTSEDAMSKQRSMFRSPESLADEFISQYESSK